MDNKFKAAFLYTKKDEEIIFLSKCCFRNIYLKNIVF